MVLESISKFFRLVLNGVYIDGNVLVASLVENTRLLLHQAKGCRRYNGPGYDKKVPYGYVNQKSRLLPLQSTLT